ncbi:MAG: hemolysin family protein [Geminicoccaceae bacterium]
MTLNWELLQDPVIIARLILQVVLFADSAFFSMSETALFALRETDLQRVERQDGPKARRLRGLLDEPRQLIVSILCGNELINIAATINLAGLLLAFFGDPQTAALINTIVMLSLLLIFCEITPKSLAVSRPAPLSTQVIEPVMSAWVRLVMPLRLAVRFVSDRVTTLIIGDQQRQQYLLSTDEFRTLLHDVEQEGLVNMAERRLIVNLIEAGSTEVAQIMVPRPQVAFIDADLPMSEIIERFRTLRHRRVPVFRDQRDNVLGVIKEQRLLDLLAVKGADAITLDEVIEPATLIPTTQTISELCEYFKDGDHHAAIVVNEFGGVEGLVTMDDVFRFLTEGEGIHFDQYARIEEPEEGVYRCAGLTPIRALRRTTHLPLEEDAGVSTVGGLVMALMNRVPAAGDQVEDAGMVFRVLSMNNLLVDQVLVAPVGHPCLASPAAVSP